MKLYKKFFSRRTGVAMLATMGLFACQPEIEVETPVSGSADFTTYVALGNSLTAGFADGGVYREAQINSYPEMMAKSMQETGGATGFSTPLMPTGNGSGYLQLQLINGAPTPVPVAADPSAFASIASGGPYQNLGVPGARVKNLTQVGYGSSQGNPFYARFASNPGATVVGEAAAQNPTFFTLWIGNNDVLGYATSGGDQGGDEITPVEEFRADFDKIMVGMDGASGGAIANIPNILAAPYFTTAAYNAFVIDAAQAAALNAGLRATVEAGARPQVVAGVTAVVREQVTAGVTEFVRENQVRPGVTAVVTDTVRARVTRGLRAQIRPQVTAAVRAQAIQNALDAGASQTAAEAAADAFIASSDGQAAIEAQLDTQIQTPEAQAGIEAEVQNQLETDEVKAQIEANIDEQMQSPLVQAGIQAEVDTRMQSPEIQATIEENVQAQLETIFATLPSVSEGANPFVIQGAPSATNPTGLRSATPDDLILLTVLSYTASPEFQALPVLPESLVLDVDEQAKVNAAIDAYNGVIQDAAGSKYAYVDINDFFGKVISGFSYQGVTYSPTFVTGGAFSLDGIHLTQRGYALAGNEFIKSINAKYNAKLSLINTNDYRGVLFP
ncbi:SGNH/GDSL hydrolase family protein [Bernardetia sp. ABR2-2B]|uniref:SGNH/GDSL hydrolase family protein n=1 Tax=Bernardetia sp. ABR2-2B TaxID=3127472 RepID=UPI0030D1AD81